MKNITIVFLTVFLMSLNGVLIAQDFFAEWDANRDGKLTIEEFPGGQANIDYFRKIDANRDGIIIRAEFDSFMSGTKPPEQPVSRPPQHQPQQQQKIKNLEVKIQELEQKLVEFRTENQNLKNRVAQLEKLNQELDTKNNQLQQLLKIKPVQPVQPIHPVQPVQPIHPVQPVQPVQPIAPQQLVIPDLPQPSTTPAQDMLMAEEGARLDAYRSLASLIRGNWIAAISKDIDGQNKLLVIGKLDPTSLVGVKQLDSHFDFVNGMVTVPVEITRAYIIESIGRCNSNMNPEEYQELRFMFPETVSAQGFGAWTDKAQKQLLALHGAQIDARRKLIEQLRGVMIKSSTRMENFVVTSHQVVASIETSLLIGVQVVATKIVNNAIAEVTIKISRPMFIYSMRKGLQSNGLDMSPEEYQNFRNMLDQPEYTFVGKAAIK